MRNREVVSIEARENAARKRTEGGGERQDPDRLEATLGDPRSGAENRPLKTATSWGPGSQDSTRKRNVPLWAGWQSALYMFVLGTICLVLAPLTNFWWMVLVCGMAVPIAPAMLRRSDDRKLKEQELLHAIAERGYLTPTTAAMLTSLTVDEASKMLEELAIKGHLELQTEDGVVACALKERDRDKLPSGTSTLPETEHENGGAVHRPGALQRLDDPLSERELEVLNLLDSGKTNSEVAQDLFVARGTVKAHVGNIYRKLEAHNRAEALSRARGLGLLR